jgi:iron complex outermembrane receptor protein
MLRVVRRCLTWLSFAGVIALVSPPAALAQANGRISGTVRDSTGAAREGATVRATNTATGAVRSATSGANGAYAITGLASGTYDVTATLLGYRRATQSDVRVDGDTRVDLTLAVLPLQSIVVTATLREQELADVPFSIAAPTARELRERGVENIEQIAVNVAGFSVQNLGPGQSQVAIRGASAGQIARDQPGVKEQVGAYLDDSPISLSLFTPDLDLFDVARVEVLRGPQGTLFGAGSLSGTVRYITNQPQLGERSTFGEVGGSWVGGGNGGADVKIGTNVPLGDRAAARMVVFYNRLPGYMDAVQPDLGVRKNLNTGQRTGVRAAFLLQPNEQFSVVPRLVYQNVRTEGWNRIDAFNILANPYTTTRPAVTLGEREQFTQIPEPFTDRFAMGDLKLSYDAGGVNLTSVTAYTDRDILVVRDAGALTSSITGGSIGLPEDVYTLNAPLDDATRSKVFTQEVRLSGVAGPARWLVGGFFSKNTRKYGQSLIVSGFEAATGGEIPTEGLRAQRDELFYSDLDYDLTQSAIFGEATINATSRLELTGGIRYYNFDEDREQIFDGIFANDNTGTSLVSTPGSTKADGFAPRAIANLRVSDALSFNAQVSRGFRLGGINDPLNEPLCTDQDLITFGGRDSWKDETAWNYEVGAKSRLMNGRASFNVSAFYMDIRDLQMTVTAGSCSSRLIFNTPKAVSSGVELEFSLAPTPNFDLSFSGTFNNAELRSTLTTTDEQGNTSVLAGIEDGNRLPSVPKTQASAAATYRYPFATGTQGYVTGTWSYVGNRYTQIDDQAAGFGVVDLTTFGDNTIGGPLTQGTFRFDPLLPSYNLFNLRVGLTRVGWDLALFVNNLTDERALLALDRERGTLARVGYLTNRPRTVGLSMGFRY